MESKVVDKKVLDRVRKLLALAADGGATEHEAALAAERARQIMAENGISNATIEAGGGEGEARTTDTRRGHTGKMWMRDIMRALADQAFVVVDYETGSKRTTWDEEKQEFVKGHSGRWQLWGRESSVITVKLMHEYLVRTVDRVARERGTPTDELFKEAMGSRIAERIEERHSSAMAEQARTAREARAAAAHPSSASSNALVVVLEDYAQKERDLNNDLKYSLKPGTTAQRRAERVAAEAARIAERETRRQALLNEGLSAEIVELMMSGISRERAEKLASEPEHVEKNEKDEARRAKENEKWQARWKRQQERANARQSSPSYRAGRSAGENVGLDSQVGTTETKKLS